MLQTIFDYFINHDLTRVISLLDGVAPLHSKNLYCLVVTKDVLLRAMFMDNRRKEHFTTGGPCIKLGLHLKIVCVGLDFY